MSSVLINSKIKYEKLFKFTEKIELHEKCNNTVTITKHTSEFPKLNFICQIKSPPYFSIQFSKLNCITAPNFQKVHPLLRLQKYFV